MSHHNKTFVSHLHQPQSQCAACITRGYLLSQLSDRWIFNWPDCLKAFASTVLFLLFWLITFFFYLQTHKLTQAGISWHRGKHLHRNRGWDTIHGDICTLKQQHRDYCYSCLFVFISGQTSSNKMLSGVRGCPWHHIKYNNEKQNQWNKQIQMHKCWECCCVAKCGQLLEFAAT